MRTAAAGTDASCAWTWLFQHPPRRSECDVNAAVAGQLVMAVVIMFLLYDVFDAYNDF